MKKPFGEMTTVELRKLHDLLVKDNEKFGEAEKRTQDIQSIRKLIKGRIRKVKQSKSEVNS